MANVALLFHQWCHGNATFSSQALKMRLQINSGFYQLQKGDDTFDIFGFNFEF